MNKALYSLFPLLVVFLFCTPLQAENMLSTEVNSTAFTPEEDSTETELDLFLPESLDQKVDSLMQTWHANYFSKRDTFCHDDNKSPTFSNEVYRDRLLALPTIIPMDYNSTVQKYINLYVVKQRRMMSHLLGMADHYFPIIETILAREGLPLELKYLAVVESALNPAASSRSGASGLWQFILPTAKAYGLTVNTLIDERKDPVKSTEAACRYLKDMYSLYGDWYLVIASFNCGLGNVNKAIRRANGKKDFWKIYNYLPRETRLYVPIFIAATYAMNYHCEHNICAVSANIPLATDTLHIHKMLNFDQIASILKVDKEVLRALNPQYLRDIVPGNIGTATVTLPAAECYALSCNTSALFRDKAEALLGKADALNAPKNSKKTGAKASTSSLNTSGTYRVRSGDSLYTIAKRYPGVSIKDLQRANNLRSSSIRPGQVLRIPKG